MPTPSQRPAPQTRKKKASSAGADIDWYIISVATLKKGAIAIVALLVLAGGYWAWYRHTHRPQDEIAAKEIAEAKELLNKVAALPEIAQIKEQFVQAQDRLEEAEAQMAKKEYDLATNAALASQEITRRLLGSGGEKADATFLTVEGSVEFQRANESRWESAKARGTLFAGDFVRTGSNGAAEIQLSDGTIYRIRPDTLFEVERSFDAEKKVNVTGVRMTSGIIDMATGDSPSTVDTPYSTAEFDTQTRGSVTIDPKTRQERVSVQEGGGRVRLGQGASEELSPREEATTQDGKTITVKLLPLAPALLDPGNDKVYALQPNGKVRVELQWQAVVEARAYHLQVSHSHLFLDNPVDLREHSSTKVKLELPEEGAYYWRVATRTAIGMSAFSSYRRFKVLKRVEGTAGLDSRPTPKGPSLTCQTSDQIGNIFIVSGQTEPGSTVTVNDEMTDVSTDGTFRKPVSLTREGEQFIVVKATSPAGGETVKRLKVFLR